MKRALYLIAIAIGISSQGLAQNDVDALRYSMLQYGSTARSLGTGGAFGALGGDFSSLSINPAGLGVYRKSEFTFSPALARITSDATYYGDRTEDERYNFHFTGAGLVINTKRSRRRARGWKAVNFGMGFNRLANYNSEVYYTGYNPDNSLLDNYLSGLNAGDGTNPSEVFNYDPFGAGLAYETYLINPLATDTTHFNSVIPSGGVQQSKTIETRGATDELAFALGGNYNDKFFVGGTIGVPIVHYDQDYTYKEEDIDGSMDDFESFELRNRLETVGTGLNFKFGMIFRLNDYVRIGGSIHSPTIYRLSDSYSSSMQANLDTTGFKEYSSPAGSYTYYLRTPWRVVGSLALVFKQFGFVSVDYEWLDYGEAAYDFTRFIDTGDGFLEGEINETIEAKYTGAHNIRLGGELKLDMFRIRGGYAWTGSPFRNNIAADDADFSSHTFTGGLGIKEKGYSFDVAYAHKLSKEYDLQYNLPEGSGDVSGAELDKTTGTVVMTVGFRF